MITIKNKFLLFSLIFITLLFTLLSYFCPTTVRAEESTVNFEETNVLDDLNSSETFDIKKYPFVDDGFQRLEIINVVEYCYSFYKNKQDNFGLYLYIYNPSAMNIDKDSVSNKVQMAVSFDEDGRKIYEKLSDVLKSFVVISSINLKSSIAL